MRHRYKKGSYAILIFLVISCNSSKFTSNKNHEYYQKRGYSRGILLPKDTGNCGWVLSVSKNLGFDPINIEEKKFLPFSLKKQVVYFKFLPLRMKSRCKDYAPIKLIEVISGSGIQQR